MTAAPAPAVSSSAVVPEMTIEGFRTIRDATLRMGPVTALVGEANAGKSNLLAAISLAVDAGPVWPTDADLATGAERIVLEAVTDAGPVGLRYERTGARSRLGSWPVAMLPASLRDGPVIAPAQDAAGHHHHGVVALAGALRSQATHAVSPAAHAHGLVAGLEQCCDAGVSGVLLLIEEPELFLRPQAQRYLYRLLHRFADAGNQVVYSTHAPALLNVAQLDELVVVTRDAERGTTVHQAAALPASEGFRAMSEFDAERGELFLADVAVLVEGRTEKLALPHVFRALGVDVDREGISIVECGGKANLVVFARLCQATGVPYLVLHDRDAPPGRDPIASERRLNELLRAIVGEQHVVELAPDFEAVAGLRRRRHKPEEAWRAFRSLGADDVPDALRRLVESAAALTAPGHRSGARS